MIPKHLLESLLFSDVVIPGGDASALTQWGNSIQGFAELCFGMICHQDPLILMKIDGGVFQLCPRCTGLHLGVFLSFIVLSIVTHRRFRFEGTLARIVLALPFALILAHWLLLRLALWPPDAHSRLFTGLACGSAISFLLVAYRRDLLNRSPLAARNIGPLQISLLAAFSVSVGLALVSYSGLTVLSAIVLVVVLLNGCVAIHTFLLLLSRSFKAHRKIPSTIEREVP